MRPRRMTAVSGVSNGATLYGCVKMSFTGPDSGSSEMKLGESVPIVAVGSQPTADPDPKRSPPPPPRLNTAP